MDEGSGGALTNQEKVQYLKRYQAINRSIDQKLEEISMWRNRASKMGHSLSDMPRGGERQDQVQSAIDKICELETSINSEIDQLVLVRQDIENVINQVQDEVLKTLLKYRYLNGFTWEQIAVLMNYSYMQICRLHGKALNQIKML